MLLWNKSHMKEQYLLRSKNTATLCMFFSFYFLLFSLFWAYKNILGLVADEGTVQDAVLLQFPVCFIACISLTIHWQLPLGRDVMYALNEKGAITRGAYGANKAGRYTGTGIVQLSNIFRLKLLVYRVSGNCKAMALFSCRNIWNGLVEIFLNIVMRFVEVTEVPKIWELESMSLE